MRFFLILALALSLGFFLGKKERPNHTFAETVYPASSFPIKEKKSFVFILYTYNQKDWIQRSLSSILEQDYDEYRIIIVDDGSTDGSLNLASAFLQENNQESKATFIQKKRKEGELTCLYQAISNLPDQEIVIPFNAKDFLSYEGALREMNLAFQDPDIWLASASTMDFPSYSPNDPGLFGFYAALFKQISINTLKEETGPYFYKGPIEKIAEGKYTEIPHVLHFSNQAAI